MPHTSSKKKRNDGRKRAEVTDDDGWTRVTTKFQANDCLEPHAVNGHDYSPSRNPSQEPYGHPIVTPGRLEAPPGASVKTITQNYEKAKKLWLASKSFTALQSALRSRLDPARKIRSCTIFGSGSFCGLRQGWIGRHEVALIQIAVFASAIEIIGK